MTLYQISVEAKNLKGRLFRQPRPYAVISKIVHGSKSGEQIGRTGVDLEKENSDWMEWRNPNWVEVFKFEWDGYSKFPFRVTVYDERQAQNDHVMAGADFEVQDVISSEEQVKCETDKEVSISVNIQKSKHGSSEGFLTLHLRGLDLKNVEAGCFGLGRTDPYFEVSKATSLSGDPQKWKPIYRSEVIEDHLNPLWKEESLALEDLCHCDFDWPLFISVWDYEEDGWHRQIGGKKVTVRTLMENVAIRGNADREKCFIIYQDEEKNEQSTVDPTEGSFRTEGLICILKATPELS